MKLIHERRLPTFPFRGTASRLVAVLLFLPALCAIQPAPADATVLVGPDPYLQASDSPFAGMQFDWFRLTDGRNSIPFEVFDSTGASLGLLSGDHADGSNGGTSGEDRFHGVTSERGVSAITIKCGVPNSGGGLEVDHLQYGYHPVIASDVPPHVSKGTAVPRFRVPNPDVENAEILLQAPSLDAHVPPSCYHLLSGSVNNGVRGKIVLF